MMYRVKQLTLLMGAFLISFTALSVTMTSAAEAATNGAPCNMDTAKVLLQENPGIDLAGPPFMVGKVLCGEFLEPGTESMVIAFAPPTCGGYFGWAAFRRSDDGSWQLVFNYHNGQSNLEAVGSNIEETNTILGPNDARCVGVKATKTRVWHWDGQKFVAGPWVLHLLGTAPTFVAEWPGAVFTCIMADDPSIESALGNYHNGVTCISVKVSVGKVYRQLANLKPSGRTRTCQKHSTSGCSGPFTCGCSGDSTRVYAGEQVVVGRFTCQVLKKSVQCTLTTGQGFLISPKGIKLLS